MQNLRNRYYNPETGTMTALDPFEGLIDAPMSLNGYSYAHGNPVNLTDPSGEFAIVPLILTLAGFALGIAAGAAVGAALGGVFGHLYGELSWRQVVINKWCGECPYRAAVELGHGGFVRRYREAGMVIGALLGALTALGPIGALATGAVLFIGGLIGMATAAHSMWGNSWNPFSSNNLTICNITELLLSALITVGGIKTIGRNLRPAYNQLKGLVRRFIVDAIRRITGRREAAGDTGVGTGGVHISTNVPRSQLRPYVNLNPKASLEERRIGSLLNEMAQLGEIQGFY